MIINKHTLKAVTEAEHFYLHYTYI